MLQPLSLAAPPVSASLLFNNRIPAESAQAATHLLHVHQALCYLPGYMLPAMKLPRFTGI